MTVYKTYFKLFNKMLFIIFIYLIITISITVLTTSNSQTKEAFVTVQPKVLIVNKDEETKLVKNFIKYLESRSKVTIKENIPKDLDDAIFFNDYDEVIIIPKNFSKNFFNNKEVKLDVKHNADYGSNMLNIWIGNYLNKAQIYLNEGFNENEILNSLDNTFKVSSEIKVQGNNNSNTSLKINIYYNMLNYNFIAMLIYFITTIMGKFNYGSRRKRQMVGGTPYKVIIKKLFISNLILSIGIWLLFILLSFILFGSLAYSQIAIWMMINSFVFMISAMSLAFLISTFISDDNAIAMAQNLLGLGTSFISGAFVPAFLLPTWVLSITKVFTSYWYINNNDYISGISSFTNHEYIYIFKNLIIIIFFSIIFYVVAQYINKKKLSKET